MNYCIEEFKKQSKIDLAGNPRALSRLKEPCEGAKIRLSTEVETTIRDLLP